MAEDHGVLCDELLDPNMAFLAFNSLFHKGTDDSLDSLSLESMFIDWKCLRHAYFDAKPKPWLTSLKYGFDYNDPNWLFTFEKN